MQQSTIHPAAFIHSSAIVEHPCSIGEGTSVWHFSHVMPGARIGRHCVLGQNVFVAADVIVGDHTRVQNNVSLYTGVELEETVFLGPSCVFTNVLYPRAELPRKKAFVRTLVQRGASIGANATVLCGAVVGRYAMVGAGAVVRGEVPDYSLMLGVPARRHSWVGRHGLPLRPGIDPGDWLCPESGFRYREVRPGVLRCLDFPEDRRLSSDPQSD